MATTLSGQVSALATQVGVDVKSIISNIGVLSNLTTTQKASLVLAINELKAAIGSLEDSVAGSVGIDDSTLTLTTTWSSSKIKSSIDAAVAALVDGSPEALNTLKELADAITQSGSAIAALESLVASQVKFNEAQSLSSAQQAQARTNIGAAANADLTTLSSKVGALTSLDTSDKTSAVAAINEALNKANAAQGTANSALAVANQNASNVGALNGLSTTAKTTIVAAINEVATKVVTLETNVGDTTTDFAAVYVAARG